MSKIDKSKIVKESIDWYIKNQAVYRLLGLKVDNILKELIELEGIPYHAIFNRSKEIESFSNKLQNKNYSNGYEDVKDLAGIRIITYVESQIEPICTIIEKNFEIDNENSHDKSEELGIDKVGYKSVHYVAKLNKDRLGLPEYKRFENRYFEIQVRTILQHAWAEIEHDRNYKFSGVLPKAIQRRIRLLAGMLESADREFNLISEEIDNISKQVAIATKSGELNIPLNSTSLKQFFSTRFESLEQYGFQLGFISQEREIMILSELERFGIKTLEELDKLIPENFLNILIETGEANVSSFGSKKHNIKQEYQSKSYGHLYRLKLKRDEIVHPKSLQGIDVTIPDLEEVISVYQEYRTYIIQLMTNIGFSSQVPI